MKNGHSRSDWSFEVSLDSKINIHLFACKSRACPEQLEKFLLEMQITKNNPDMLCRQGGGSVGELCKSRQWVKTEKPYVSSA